jgi:hypothetical protein
LDGKWMRRRMKEGWTWRRTRLLALLFSHSFGYFVVSRMKQFFHGARVIDAHSAALTLKQRVVQPDQMLVGVGYSLGAIVLNNYVASYGKRTALDAAVSISGSLNCHYQTLFQRSQRTWQPMIAAFMKDELLLPKWGRRIQKRLGPNGFRAFLRASTVVVRM